MEKLPTAQEFLERKYGEITTSDKTGVINGNFWEAIKKEMVEFAQMHINSVKDLQKCKYRAGETGYLTENDWKEIIEKIK